MSQLLVSCPNAKTGGLFLLDTKTGDNHHLFGKDCRGLDFLDDNTIVIAVGPDLKVYDLKKGKQLWSFSLEFLPGPGLHDVAVHKDRVYAVASGANAVAVFEGARSKNLRYVGRVHFFESSYNRIHLNCILPTDSGLLASRFSRKGRKEDQSLAEVLDGAITFTSWGTLEFFIIPDTKTPAYLPVPPHIYLTSPETPIEHPHDLEPVDGGLLHTSSMKNEVYFFKVFREWSQKDLLYRFPEGYIRGIYVDSDTHYIGQSCPAAHPTMKHRQGPAHAVLHKMPEGRQYVLQGDDGHHVTEIYKIRKVRSPL